MLFIAIVLAKKKIGFVTLLWDTQRVKIWVNQEFEPSENITPKIGPKITPVLQKSIPSAVVYYYSAWYTFLRNRHYCPKISSQRRWTGHLSFEDDNNVWKYFLKQITCMYLFYLLLILVIFFPFTESFQFTHTGPAFNVSHAETDFVNVNHPLPMYVLITCLNESWHFYFFFCKKKSLL